MQPLLLRRMKWTSLLSHPRWTTSCCHTTPRSMGCHRMISRTSNHHSVLSSTLSSSLSSSSFPTLEWQQQRQRRHFSSRVVHKDDLNKKKDKNNKDKQHSNTSSSNMLSSSLYPHVNLQLDYFGEPVSFLRQDNDDDNNSKDDDAAQQLIIINAMAALDGFSMAVVSRGQTCSGGGSEDGLEAKSAHSVAMAWAECLRHAALWNQLEKQQQQQPEDAATNNSSTKTISLPKAAAPMLVVAAVGPLLAQTGLGYTRYIDHLLGQAKTGVQGLDSISLMDMARAATQHQLCRQLYPRERWHLRALDCMLRQEHRKALSIYIKLLHSCPGDALAVALAMDLAHKLGDRDGALTVAGTVAAYWNDRRAAGLRPAMPGHFLVSAWIALGFAAGGRYERAEFWADQALEKDRRKAAGVATWALAHIYDAEGRTAEGISMLANSEGRQNYEKCGLLFFQCLLGGYGAHFSIDREGWGRMRSQALRLYISEFQRVLEYSGFAVGKPWQEPMLKAPWGFREVVVDAVSKKSGSFWNRLLGRTKDGGEAKEEPEEAEEFLPATDEKWYGTSLKAYKMEPQFEDVLCWLPPTPQMLTQATLLLFRLTINGTLTAKNQEWDKLRNAWSCFHQIQTMAGVKPADTYPLAALAANLLSVGSVINSSDDNNNNNNDDDDATMTAHGHAAEGLRLMGELLDLGNSVTATAKEGGPTSAFGSGYVVQYNEKHERLPTLWSPEDDVSRSRWKQVVNHLYAGVGGTYWSGLLGEDTSLEEPDLDMVQKVEGWEMDVRPILEHAICFAACKSGDMDALYLARAVSSKSVTLRPNSPEEWWRYSMILTLLGDEVAADDAFEASIGFGSGQGQTF